MKRTQKNFFLPNDRCCYCNRPFVEGLLATREHIIPKSKGGTDTLINLKPCCIECNQIKGDLDIKQFQRIAWEIIKILNGKYSINLKDIETIYENLKNEDIYYSEKPINEDLQKFKKIKSLQKQIKKLKSEIFKNINI